MKNLFLCFVCLITVPSFAKVSCADAIILLSGKYTADYLNHSPSEAKTTLLSMGFKIFNKTWAFWLLV